MFDKNEELVSKKKSIKEKCLISPKQLIKSIILLICIIVVIFQISTCIRKICNPPITTYTHFDFNETISYPAVTVCRDPPYKFDILQKYGLYGHPRYTSEWKHFNFTNSKLDDLWDESTYTDVDNFISYGLHNSTDNLILKNTLHFVLGRCQTLYPKIKISTASKETGYSLSLNHSMLYIENTPSTIPPGYHVYIHQVEEPFEEFSSINLMEYLYVNVGEELEVKLSVQRVNILPNGPKICRMEDDYSSTLCSKQCIWKKLTENVGCSGPWMDTNIPYCSNYTNMRNLIVQYIQLAESQSCTCPQRCRSSIYSTYVVDRNSLTMWDSRKRKWDKKNEDVSKLQTQLYIYFNNKMISVYEEFHGYDWSLFLADFGGSLGFLLGLSVLGVIALLEDIFDILIKPFLSQPPKLDRENTLDISDKKMSSAIVNCNENSNFIKDYENFNFGYGDKNFYI